MTDVQFETYVRSLLNEGTAVFWTAADLAACKQVAILVVTSTFWSQLFQLKKWPVLYSLAAGENNLDLPVGWQKIVRVEIASTGQALKPIADQELPEYMAADSDEPAGYLFVRGKLRILPDSGAAKTDYIRVWFLPRSTTLAELPEALHPLIAIETVLAGRTKDENVSPYLSHLRDRFEAVARKDLAQYQTQAPLAMDDEYEIESC